MCFTNSVFSFAAVAAAAAAYAARLAPALADPVIQKLVSVSVIGVFAALNYRGAKPGALAVDIFTAGKFLVLLILVTALLGRLDVAHFASGPMPTGLGNLGTATFIALFAAQGFEVVPVPAGETRRPERDVPFAVLSSLTVASVLYLVVQVALVGSGANLSTPSDAPLADAAIAIAPVLGVVISVGGLISTLGFVSGSALGTPRYLYAVALAGQLPQRLASVHPRFQSPHVAVMATALLAIGCVLPFDYRALIGMSNVAVAVQYLATSLAVQKLGKDKAARPSPWISWTGAAVSLWIFTEASGQELIWAAASLLVGASLVLLTTRAAAKPA
jgi:amino acid transporter